MEDYSKFEQAAQLLKDYANSRQIVENSSVGIALQLAIQSLSYVKTDLERLDFAISECKKPEMKQHYQNLKDANLCGLSALKLEMK